MAFRSVVMMDGSRPGRPDMPLIFHDGKAPALSTYYGGAMRVRVLPRAGSTPKNGTAGQNSEDGTLVTFEFSPEPKMGLRNFLNVRVEKMLDEKGYELKTPLPHLFGEEDLGDLEMQMRGGFARKVYYDGGAPPNLDLSTRVPLRLRIPEGTKKLKEIHGYVAAEVLTPPMPLVTVENILEAAGKKVEGKNGATLNVSAVKRDDKGQVTITVAIDRPPADSSNQATVFVGRRARLIRRGGIVTEERMNDVATVGRFLSLVDDKGQAFKLTATEEKAADDPDATSVVYQLTFQPPTGDAKPGKLIYTGRRKATIDVPFVLKDVAVP
jgi:hypothetical protein